MATGAASSMTKSLLADEVQPEVSTPPHIQPSGRDRWSSTDSHPNDTFGSSLLARVVAKRIQDVNKSDLRDYRTAGGKP